MLTELRFVQGAVAKKDLVPAMTHFRIERGTVRSYNGVMAIGSPIALDIDCCPKADAMIRAITNCEEATTITLTPAGRLSVRSGKFRVLLPVIQDDTPHIEPAGEPLALDGEHLLAALRILEPFISTDASRPWTNGVLLDGQSAYATNNVCMVQYWLGSQFPRTINVPRAAVKELLRVGEPPTHAQVDKGSITFHYTGDRWIRTQLLEVNWPMEKISEMLDKPCNPTPIDPALFAGLAKLKAMVDGVGRVYLRDGGLHTSTEAEEGSSYDLGLPYTGCYSIQMLGLLEGVVSTIDLGLYPGPCLFFGDRLRGAIIGMLM